MPTPRDSNEMIRTIDTLKGEIFEKLGVTEANDIVTNGVSIRIGNKIYTLKQVAGSTDIPIEAEIRAEYETKFMSRLSEIGKFVNEKMSGIHTLVTSIKGELDRREVELKRRMENLPFPMPTISTQETRRGLSIMKNPDNENEIFWIIPAWYGPKWVDDRKIKTSYISKLVRPMRIFICTNRENKITGLSTRKMTNLEFFSHYHQVRPDCWGNWKWSSEKFAGPADAIRIADIAIGIIDKVNTSSIGNRSPEDLPSITTLRGKLESLYDVNPITPPEEIPPRPFRPRPAGPGFATTTDDTWDTTTR
jgi:hypothetical protein